MGTVALRASLIWRDEVMEDLVLEQPTTVTVGTRGRFVVPDLGLPKSFAIVRPGNRGYLLTLGERMRGTICIDGKEQQVADFVRTGHGGGSGGFRATPISGRDWGVIDLDESGEFKLFFQFVPLDERPPVISRERLMTMGAVYLGIALVLTFAFFLIDMRGVRLFGFLPIDFGSPCDGDLPESFARGMLVATIMFSIVLLTRWVILRFDPESQMSLAFSVILHVALWLMTFIFYDPTDPFVWPGPPTMTAQYLASRIKDEPPPPPPPKAAGAATEGMAAPKTPDPPKVVKTKGLDGKAGGEGEKPRAIDPNNKNNEAPKPPPVALFTSQNEKRIDNIIDRNLSTNLSKFEGISGDVATQGSLGFGPGHGSGVGEGTGTGTTRGSNGKGAGGGGHAVGDYVANAKDVDTGGLRSGGGNCAKPPCGIKPHEIKVSVGEAEGDIEGLTAEEINRVVKARAPMFRACYQRELNRTPGLGGKLVMHFVIGGDGSVKSAKTSGGSSMRNDAVEECVQRQIMTLHFPAKGGISNVNYPFVFQPGG
jgi:outer membrane biosynthesis protein TonB